MLKRNTGNVLWQLRVIAILAVWSENSLGKRMHVSWVEFFFFFLPNIVMGIFYWVHTMKHFLISYSQQFYEVNTTDIIPPLQLDKHKRRAQVTNCQRQFFLLTPESLLSPPHHTPAYLRNFSNQQKMKAFQAVPPCLLGDQWKCSLGGQNCRA